MDKNWHTGVIKYLPKKSLAYKNIYADMVAMLYDESTALSIIQKCAITRGRKNLEDDPRSESSATAIIEENIDHGHHPVYHTTGKSGTD